MKEIFETLGAMQNTSIPVIMVVGGILFLLLGIAGGFTGKIEIPRNRQKWAIIIGCVLLIFGTALSIPTINKSKVSASEKDIKRSAQIQPIDLHFETENNLFYIGEEIKLYFKAPSSFNEKAWIGIIPYYVKHGSENENDKYDINYKYIGKKTSGILTFNTPNKPGAYDFRMHNTNFNGVEVASITFIVSVPPVSKIIYSHVIDVKGVDGISIRTDTLSKNELYRIQQKQTPDITYITTLSNQTKIQIFNQEQNWYYVKAQYKNRVITGYISAYFDNKTTVKAIGQ